MDTYTTIQGEAWDEIAVAVYGTEAEMSRLLSANPQFQGRDRLPANATLQVPELPEGDTPSEPRAPWNR